MIKAIIFDVGGTLLGAPDLFEKISDFSKHSSFSKLEIYSKSKEIFEELLTECRNGGQFRKVSEIIEMTMKKLFEFNPSEVKKVAKRLYWKVFVTDSFLFDDTKLTLDKLFNDGIELIVSSDADEKLICEQFNKHKIDKYISDYYISSAVGAYKPNDKVAKILKERIKRYNPKNVLFVGDSRVDIEIGKKIGVNTVRVGKDNNNLFNEDYSIMKLRELFTITEVNP